MAWRVARSLDQLLAQINTAHPNRSKVADGAIGDTAHAASVSDHNPDAAGVVRARDYTHDPTNGFDAHAMADRIVASHDPRIKYVISRGRIASATISPWTWRTYTGTNRHDHHAHVSVVADTRADNTRAWTITAAPQEDEVTPQEIDAVANAVVKKLLAADVIPAPKPNPTNPNYGVGSALEWTLRRSSQTYSEVAAIKAALAELAKTLPDASAKAVLDALSADYDATVTLTPKES